MFNSGLSHIWFGLYIVMLVVFLTPCATLYEVHTSAWEKAIIAIKWANYYRNCLFQVIHWIQILKPIHLINCFFFFLSSKQCKVSHEAYIAASLSTQCVKMFIQLWVYWLLFVFFITSSYIKQNANLTHATDMKTSPNSMQLH